MTIYRSGCAREGILTVEPKKEEKTVETIAQKANEIKRGELKPIAEEHNLLSRENAYRMRKIKSYDWIFS